MEMYETKEYNTARIPFETYYNLSDELDNKCVYVVVTGTTERIGFTCEKNIGDVVTVKVKSKNKSKICIFYRITGYRVKANKKFPERVVERQCFSFISNELIQITNEAKSLGLLKRYQMTEITYAR